MNGAATFRWEGLNPAAVADLFGLSHVEMLAEVDSTLDVAHQRAELGARSGSLIVADAQRAGRGRMGRSWSSEPGRGVWCTLIERPDDLRALDVLSIRAGVAIAERLDAIAGERVAVKWPNDLVVRAGKLGGILTEARWSGSTLGWVAIGVGVNVIEPVDVAGAAGLPAGVRRADVLAAIVRGVREAASKSGHLDAGELKRFHDRDMLSGRRLLAPAVGVARGITEGGALAIETASGIEHHRSGTVQFAEAS